MTQRSPQNARNLNNASKGKSRKSASSAKIASKAASSVYTRSKDAKSKASPKGPGAGATKASSSTETKAVPAAEQVRRRERAMVSLMKDMPEYKKWRRIWWILMAIAIVGVAISWVPNALMGNGIVGPEYQDVSKIIAGIGFGLAIIALIGAFYIDLVKIRKLQKQQENKARSLNKNERRKLDNAIEASIENDQNRRAERKGSFPWSKKGAKSKSDDETDSE
jgi:uncharacterized membrane protein YcjF (UPF0283 family)